DPHGEMIHVAGRRLWRSGCRNQIDQRCAGPQLDEPGLVEPALDTATQDLFVKFDGAVEAGDPQHDMVEAGDTNPGLGARSTPGLDVSGVRHCRLLLLAVGSLYRELAGAGSRIIAASAQTVER